MQKIGDSLFHQATYRWKINVDIAAQIMMWGLDIGGETMEVLWVMTSLFAADLILDLGSA